MKRIFITLFIAAGLAHIASAANWVQLGISKDLKTALYMDYGSIQRQGGSATAWVKYADENGEYYLEHQQFRRDTRDWRLLSYVHYGKTGAVLDTHDLGESALWLDIPPDSFNEILYEALFARSSESGDKQGV